MAPASHISLIGARTDVGASTPAAQAWGQTHCAWRAWSRRCVPASWPSPTSAISLAHPTRGHREMQLCMELIADTGRLASLDVIDINPALDVRNGTADLAVEFVLSLFAASTLAR